MGRGRKTVALLGVVAALDGWGVAWAEEVSYTASVDRNEVALNQQLSLTLSISVPDPDQVSDLQLPDTGNLNVVGTSRGESTSISLSGGGQSFRRIQNIFLVLVPTKLGKTTIGPASLRYRGKKYTTDPITIQVVQAQTPTRRPMRRSPLGRLSPLFDDDFFRSPLDDFMERRVEIGENDIFAKAYASPDLVVEGQQVTVTVVVYARIGAQISPARWPKLDSFFNMDRDIADAKVEPNYINGMLYQRKLVAQKALFPLQPGEFTIGPIEVEVQVSTSPFFPGEARVLRTQPLKVKVVELPAKSRPDNFQEANVGSFTLSSAVDANQASLNQPVTYKLVVRGTGNIQRVRPPQLPELPGFKRFDPAVEVKVSKQGREVKGSKTSEYILVPLASGSLNIPSLEFVFYDPQAGEFHTLRTQPETIQVAASQLASVDRTTAGSHEISILAGAFKPIRYESSLSGYGSHFYRHSLFLPLLAAPPGFYLLLLGVNLFLARIRQDSQRNRMRRAWVRGRRRLRKAGQVATTGRAADFYMELKTALMAGIEARIGVSPQGLTLEELKVRMQEAGTSGELTEELGSEIENCDFGRFAPATTRGEEMQASLERVRRFMKKLERERVRPLREAR